MFENTPQYLFHCFFIVAGTGMMSAQVITLCGTSWEASSKLDKLTNQKSIISNTSRGKNTESSAWPGQETNSVFFLKDLTSNEAVSPPSPDNSCQTPTGLTEGRVSQKWPGCAELPLSCLSDTQLRAHVPSPGKVLRWCCSRCRAQGHRCAAQHRAGSPKCALLTALTTLQLIS